MISNLHQVVELIEKRWQSKNVLVIGDVMLDRYIWGDVERISPEAPVPVVRVAHQTEQPGGAGNVAMNIAKLGAKAKLFGMCGDDAESASLCVCLEQEGIELELVRAPERPTTSKLRIVAGKQQILRVDTERTSEYSADAYAALIARLERSVPSADAIVLSDYAKGVLSEEVCQAAIRFARQRNIPVLVDPKQRSFERYRGATTICPNLSELSVATGLPAKDTDAVLSAGQSMVPELELECLTATLSEKGIALLRRDSKVIAPAVARQVFDVSGAGDAVIATLALSLAGGLQMQTAIQLANVAGGIAVSKIGTMPVTREELLLQLMPEIELQAEEKVLPLVDLQARVSAWRSAGQSVVFTNGCFDLLHVGHITLLEDARHEGDRLVVAINTDASVAALKGPTRPIVGERERARMLAALSAVDAVVTFDEPTPIKVIEAIRPDVIVKGGDYEEDSIVGAKEVRAWGGKVKIVPTVEGFSTTKLVSKMIKPQTEKV